MKLELSDFSSCGFPEEHLFWVAAISSFVVIITIASLHFFVNEKFKKGGFYPVLFLLFFKDAFKPSGHKLKATFIVFCCLCAMSILSLSYGIESGFFKCGTIGED